MILLDIEFSAGKGRPRLKRDASFITIFRTIDCPSSGTRHSGSIKERHYSVKNDIINRL